jgi:hypothetical protein
VYLPAYFIQHPNIWGVRPLKRPDPVKKCCYGKLPLNFSPDRKGKPGEGKVRGAVPDLYWIAGRMFKMERNALLQKNIHIVCLTG